MGAHALGAAAYAAKAAELASPSRGGDAEIQWQVQHMNRSVRESLRRLPLLGEDPSGPLGSGLLASGALGSNIRTLQAAIRNEKVD
ncbi:putative immunity protein [Microbacterium sp. P02]